MRHLLSCAPLLLLLLLLAQDGDGERLRPEIRYMQGLIKRINGLCGGSNPSVCLCDNDPKATVTPPLAQGLFGFAQILSCMPSYCKCPSGEEIDSRPMEYRNLLSLCPRDQMESCVCASDDKTVTFPFDLQTIFFECRPYKCKCRGEAVEKPVTSFGCSGGGIPYCASKTDLWCKDNSVMVTRENILHAKLDNACVCEDGLKPKCRSSGGDPVCPGGEELDLALGNPGVALQLCH